MGNFILGVVLGVVAGVLATRFWDQITDSLGNLREKAPGQEQIQSWGAKTLGFLWRNLLFVGVALVVLAIVLSNTVLKPAEKQTLVVGQTYQFYDNCGKPNLYVLTRQDVQKDAVVVGAGQTEGDKSCQLVISGVNTKYHIIVP